ncbi:hypothetical protein RND81_11G052100 [Saponaria officinalis]|uniref:DNA-3-methyladenine glycosylase I n=1 Tax=Saponaria officinalis TaxID=3572 RepID=A0AAW1HI68_SAPOF
MSQASVRKKILEKNSKFIKQKNETPHKNNNLLFKNFEKVYSLDVYRRSNSLASVSPLTLSQTSTDSSSLTDNYSSFLDLKILAESLRGIITSSSTERIDPPSTVVATVAARNDVEQGCPKVCVDGEVKRCHWITKTSDKGYVSFHDEQWGVPIYDDNQLFELLSMCGMLMDFKWPQILKRRNHLREAFGGFDVKFVEQLRERDILKISANKEVGLAECRVRCIVDNAKGIIKVMKEYGSFSSYMWSYFNYKPTINKYKYPRNVPLRSPKAEVISKELLRRGFRLVGPVIMQSFTQAAGMTIDHLIDCFRYNHCVTLAQSPWKHV